MPWPGERKIATFWSRCCPRVVSIRRRFYSKRIRSGALAARLLTSFSAGRLTKSRAYEEVWGKNRHLLELSVTDTCFDDSHVLTKHGVAGSSLFQGANGNQFAHYHITKPLPHPQGGTSNFDPWLWSGDRDMDNTRGSCFLLILLTKKQDQQKL